MKTALISGASRGMGAEFSQILSQKYNLVLVARNIAHLKKVKILCNKNSEILLVPLDLTKDTSVAELFDLLASKGIQVDILINNAGVGDYSAFEVSD
ncbi:MAG: SDR family NAD(P)-dependent oxidoreductase, partial [Nanoarchaeota archaeon]